MSGVNVDSLGHGKTAIGGRRLVFVDVLNIISSFAVVLLHTSLSVFSPERSLGWVASLASQSFAIFAVPVFFMVSGMNLLGYRSRYSTKTFMRKRLLRVGVSLLLASLFCYLLFCAFPDSFYGAERFGGAASPKEFLKGFLTNGILDIYWFLYSIVYLYILTPLLSLVVTRRRLLEYAIVLCLVVGVLMPMATHLGANPVYFQTLFGWALFSNVNLLYYLLGYYINAYARRQGIALWALGISLLSGVAMLAGGLWEHGFFSSEALAPYNNYLIGITSPLCVIEAVSLFYYVRSLENRLEGLPEAATGALRLLSQSAFGIYLFHILLVNWTGGGVLGKLLSAFPEPFPRAVLVYALTLAVVALGRFLLKKAKAAIRKHLVRPSSS